MADNARAGFKSFKKKVTGLRSSNDFGKLLDEIKEDLGLPDDTSRIGIRALLIKAVIDCYGSTIKTDMVLAALGLLADFDNRDENSDFYSGGALLTERRVKFLKESTYIALKSNGKYKSYEEAANDKTVNKHGKTPIETIKSTLGSADGRYLIAIAEKLYNKRNICEYLDAARKEHTKEYRTQKGKAVFKIKLPQLRHPIESKQEMPAGMTDGNKNAEFTLEATSPVSESQKGAEPAHEPCMHNEANATAQVSANNNVTVQVNIANTVPVPQEAKKLMAVARIFLSEDVIHLNMGDVHEIGAAVLPKGAQGAPLSYVSLDSSITTVSKDGLLKAQDKIGATQIVIQAESGVTARVNVTVQEKSSNTAFSPANTEAQKTPSVSQSEKRECRPVWGPQRPTYTNDKPADHAAFNSITDNPVLGDERDFVRIVEFRDSKTKDKNRYVKNIMLEPGKRYEVFIYYHNNASSTFNDKAHNYVGVARNTKVISNFPHELAAGETKQILGIIASSTAIPSAVWDEVNVTAKQAVTLHYVAASAKLHNDWQANGTLLSTHMFEEGNLLGVNELNGLILGGQAYSGYITYTIQVDAVERE